MDGKRATGIVLCLVSLLASTPIVLNKLGDLTVQSSAHAQRVPTVFVIMPLSTGLASAVFLTVLWQLKSRTGLILGLGSAFISLIGFLCY
jgi:hypothetical protein